MKHSLEDCELSTSYQDTCDTCGELTACICLASIVDDWAIMKGDPLFTFQWWKEGESGTGAAPSYREAMDAIAHSVICEKEGN